MVILRFRSPDGAYRIEVQPDQDISILTEKVTTEHLAYLAVKYILTW